jgi:hypothetical protein
VKQVIELLRRADAELVILRHKGGWMAPCKYIRNAAKYINEVIALLQAPRWETLEQYEKRTGEPWPENGAVWFKSEDLGNRWAGEWILMRLNQARFSWARSNLLGLKSCIICVAEAEPPPDDWMGLFGGPKETTKG